MQKHRAHQGGHERGTEGSVRIGSDGNVSDLLFLSLLPVLCELSHDWIRSILIGGKLLDG